MTYRITKLIQTHLQANFELMMLITSSTRLVVGSGAHVNFFWMLERMPIVKAYQFEG